MSENNHNPDVEDETQSQAGDAGAHDHPKPDYDDVNIPVVTLLGILSAILTFVAIAFVQGLYFNWQESMVQEDWNSRALTPQEQTVVEQKEIRDGFYETKDGKVFVSAEVAAYKMLKSADQPSKDQDQGEKKKESAGEPEKKEAEKKETETKSNPEPPGPDSGAESKSKEPSVTKGDENSGETKKEDKKG